MGVGLLFRLEAFEFRLHGSDLRQVLLSMIPVEFENLPA